MHIHLAHLGKRMLLQQQSIHLMLLCFFETSVVKEVPTGKVYEVIN